MSVRKKLLRNIMTALVRGKWLMIYGPEGVGKDHVVEEITKRLRERHSTTHETIIINLIDINASSARMLEDEILRRISDVPLNNGSDFIANLQATIEKKKKRLILILARVDVMSQDAAVHIAERFRQIYHYYATQPNGSKLTVAMVGASLMTSLGFEKTSPFNVARPVEIGSIEFEETREFVLGIDDRIPDALISAIHTETEGYPSLIKDLALFIQEKQFYEKQPGHVIQQFVSEMLGENEEITNRLVESWFSKIDNPAFFDIIQVLRSQEKLKISESGLSKEKVDLSGFLRVRGTDITFRNPIVRKFIALYSTETRLADSYWIFASRFPECWQKGCELYQKLDVRQRPRSPNTMIGPVYRNLSDLISSVGLYMTQQASRESVLTALHDALQYIFDIKTFFVCQEANEREYRMRYQPQVQQAFSDVPVSNPGALDLLKRVKENKDLMAHSWNHAYVAFPMTRTSNGQWILWIDNTSRIVTEQIRHLIASLANSAGLAILQIDEKKRSRALEVQSRELQHQTNLLNKALAHQDDYCHIVNTERRIIWLNDKAKERAAKYRPDLSGYEDRLCSEVFKCKECSLDCICEKVLETRQPQHLPEKWHNPEDSSDVQYLHVRAAPLWDDDGELAGLVQVAEDVGLLHVTTEALVDLSSANTVDEVLKTLLDSIEKVGGIRARLYCVKDLSELGGVPPYSLYSKGCRGYRDQPEFERRFSNGEFALEMQKQKYWFDDVSGFGKPIKAQLNLEIDTPRCSRDNELLRLYDVPPQYDPMREVLDKSNVMIWLKIPLFAGGTFFGLLAVDKNRLDGDFTIIECERMVAICRSAAQALYRISLTGIQKVMRDFRHVLAQQLGAINHYIRAFAHQDIPKAKRQEYSERVNNIIERLGNFSKNMAWTLPVTGTVPLQIEAISISDIVDDIYGLFTYYGRSLNIELLSENLGYTVRTDEMMLRLILYNLIDNAFTSLSKVEGDRKLTVECQVSDGSLVLYVIDNGPGINPQIWDSIYDLGFSTSKGHTGIGLTSSLELAKRLNVVLDHDRDFFPGARFYVKFPPSAIVEVKKDEIHPIS